MNRLRTKINQMSSPYQAQVWDNGKFEIHQVKEDDIDRVVNSLRRLSRNVHAVPNGKYDFSRPTIFGGMPSQYHTIYGDIDVMNNEINESRNNPYFTPYGYKDAIKILNGTAPQYYYHLKEIEMDSGDGKKLHDYAKKRGFNVTQDPDSDPDYPTWYIPGEYHWDDYFYPYPFAHESKIEEKLIQSPSKIFEELYRKNETMVNLKENYTVQEFVDQGYDVRYIVRESMYYPFYYSVKNFSSGEVYTCNNLSEAKDYLNSQLKGEKFKLIRLQSHSREYVGVAVIDDELSIYISELDAILKDALDTYNIAPEKLHLADRQACKGFEQLAAKNMYELSVSRHNEIFDVPFKSKVLSQFDTVSLHRSDELRFNNMWITSLLSKQWKPIKMSTEDIKNHLAKYPEAKIYKKDKYGYPYEINKDVLLNTKFGNTTSYYGWGSGVNSTETKVELEMDRFNNLMVSSFTMIYDSLNTHGGRYTLKESHNELELEEDMESNKKLMLVWEHFNPSDINLIYDNDFSRLESYMSTEDDVIYEDEGAVESGIFLLAHNDESEMLSFVGHSIEDVKTKFIQAVEEAKAEAQEYEDEDLNLGDPFYYCTDNLNLSSEEMFNEWIDWITSSQVDGDSGYAWHLIDIANKQVLYGNEESGVIFYDSVDEYFNDLTGGLDNTEGEDDFMISDESQFNEGLFDKKKIGIFNKHSGEGPKHAILDPKKENEFIKKIKYIDPKNWEVCEYTEKNGKVVKGKSVDKYNKIMTDYQADIKKQLDDINAKKAQQAKEAEEQRKQELKKQPHWTRTPSGAKLYRPLVDTEDALDSQYNEDLQENTITNTLPASIDNFLMDMAQMYCDFDYNDITSFGDRATEKDIKTLKVFKRELSQGFDEEDSEIQDMFREIEKIVKGIEIVEAADPEIEAKKKELKLAKLDTKISKQQLKQTKAQAATDKTNLKTAKATADAEKHISKSETDRIAYDARVNNELAKEDSETKVQISKDGAKVATAETDKLKQSLKLTKINNKISLQQSKNVVEQYNSLTEGKEGIMDIDKVKEEDIKHIILELEQEVSKKREYGFNCTSDGFQIGLDKDDKKIAEFMELATTVAQKYKYYPHFEDLTVDRRAFTRYLGVRFDKVKPLLAIGPQAQKIAEDLEEGIFDRFKKNKSITKNRRGELDRRYGLYNRVGRMVYGPFDNEVLAELELKDLTKYSDRYYNELSVRELTEDDYAKYIKEDLEDIELEESIDITESVLAGAVLTGLGTSIGAGIIQAVQNLFKADPSKKKSKWKDYKGYIVEITPEKEIHLYDSQSKEVGKGITFHTMKQAQQFIKDLKKGNIDTEEASLNNNNGAETNNTDDESMNENIFDMFKKNGGNNDDWVVTDGGYNILSTHETELAANNELMALRHENSYKIFRALKASDAVKAKKDAEKQIKAHNKEAHKIQKAKEKAKEKGAVKYVLRDGNGGRIVHSFDTEKEADTFWRNQSESQRFRLVKGKIYESVLMEKDPNLTDSQKKYVEDMYNKDMEFYGFASYDSEDDFVEDVTVDFDEIEAIEMYKYYKQLHEVNGTDESSNSNMISDLAKELRVNGPRSREDRKPEPIPGCINEINIPDEMRYKEYDFREENSALYIEWITQGSFTSEDVDIFINEVASAIDDVAKDLGIFDEFEVIIEVTSRDGKESGYAKETLHFEPMGTDSELIEEAKSNGSLSARLKARLNKLTECDSEDQLTEEKLSTRLIRRLNQGKINEASIVEEVTDTDLTEESLKWNMGSDKAKLTSEEMDLLDQLAQKLEVNSSNGYKYVVQHTYEDFGANMQWYTIVCYDKSGDSWQVLNTKDWLDLMNTGDVEAVYQSVVNGDYFQDTLAKGNIDEMNHRQLLTYMNSFEDEE